VKWFGYTRRGTWIVSQIQDELTRLGVHTDPPFDAVWVDLPIRLVSVKNDKIDPAATNGFAGAVTALKPENADRRAGQVQFPLTGGCSHIPHRPTGWVWTVLQPPLAPMSGSDISFRRAALFGAGTTFTPAGSAGVPLLATVLRLPFFGLVI